MIKIEQAFFGEKNNQHQLLCASFSDEQFITEITPLTDRPAGINSIQPYFSGHFISDRYVFIYTMPDKDAKRQGLVFSHCLILKREDVGKIDNLTPVFNSFVTSPQKEIKEINDLGFSEVDFIIGDDIKMDKELKSITSLMLKDSEPIVWIGYNGFQNIITGVWRILMPTMRTNFRFRLSDNPNDISGKKYGLINTPESNKSRWNNYKIIGSLNDDISESFALNFLENKKDNGFVEFLQSMKIDVNYPHELNRIGEIYQLFNETKKSHNPFNCNLLIRKVGALSPDKNKGGQIKQIISEWFIDSIVRSDFENILSIRNLRFEAFNIKTENISSNLTEWIESTTFNQNLPILDLCDFLFSFFNEESDSWWKRPIEKGLRRNFENLSVESISLLYTIWKNKIELINSLSQFIKSNEQNESKFLSTLTVADHRLIPEILKISKNKNWIRLHALCLYYLHKPKEAILKQLDFEKEVAIHEGILLIIEKIGEIEFIQIATEIDNPIIHSIAGKLCSEKVYLLSNIDVNNSNWQRIWYNVYLITHKIEFGLSDAQKTVFDYFDVLATNKPHINELLNPISNSDFGNIFRYPQRKLLWDKLGNDHDSFLKKTAIHFIKNIFQEKFILENEFEKYLRLQSTQSFISFEKGIPLANKIEYFKLINELNEQKFMYLFSQEYSILTKQDAEYIGQLILQNNWHLAADYVFKMRFNCLFSSNILFYCNSLLSWYKKPFVPQPLSNPQLNNYTMGKTKPKIFISYNHKDKKYAFDVRDELKKEGFDVIIDEDAMTTGLKIEEFIKRSIRESAVTISIVSENSLLSAWVAMETIYSTIEQSIRGRYFMPCKIDDKIFDRRFPDKAIDMIEKELIEIDLIIQERLDKKRGLEDLTDERTRLNKLKNEMTTIIGNFRGSFCRDISDEHFDKSMKKIIEELNRF